MTFLLRDATRYGDDRTMTALDALRTNLAEAREQLFLGALAHAAGVDDDHVCVDVVGRGFVSRLLQKSGHALGVVDVHLAAVGFDQIFHVASVSDGPSLSLLPFIRLSPSS